MSQIHGIFIRPLIGMVLYWQLVNFCPDDKYSLKKSISRTQTLVGWSTEQAVEVGWINN
jgi:hypothetical protein